MTDDTGKIPESKPAPLLGGGTPAPASVRGEVFLVFPPIGDSGPPPPARDPKPIIIHEASGPLFSPPLLILLGLGLGILICKYGLRDE